MRDEADTKINSTTRLNVSAPWAVTSARVLSGHRLSVRFADGTHGEVDASRLLFGDRAGVFERLRDPSAFARVRVEHGAVTWPGNLDLAPDAMYDAIKAAGVWILE